jgi:hypothetical protein
MTTRITTVPALDFTPPSELFHNSVGQWESVEVMPDGRTFLALRRRSGLGDSPAEVVINWQSLMNR